MKKQFGIGVALAVALGAGRMGRSAPVVAGPVTPADSKYLRENAQGSVYDFATAEVAVQKARSRAVQRYALRLLDDHTQLNKAMLQLANQRGLSLPVTLADEDKARLNTLMQASGAAFDRAYLQEAIRINADDVRQARRELSATRDSQVRAIVTQFEQTESRHLRDARALLSGKSGS